MNHPPECRCTFCLSDRRHAVLTNLARYATSGHEIGRTALDYIREIEGEVLRLGGSLAATPRLRSTIDAAMEQEKGS